MVDENTVWEDVRIGLGEIWDFERYGPLVGEYIGRTTIELPDDNSDIPGTMRDQTVYQFKVVGDSNSEAVWAVWGNWQMDQAFSGEDAGVHVGNLVRIEHLGKVSLKGGKTMNRLSIKVANPHATRPAAAPMVEETPQHLPRRTRTSGV